MSFIIAAVHEFAFAVAEFTQVNYIRKMRMFLVNMQGVFSQESPIALITRKFSEFIKHLQMIVVFVNLNVILQVFFSLKSFFASI